MNFKRSCDIDGVPKEKLLLLDHPKLMQWLSLREDVAYPEDGKKKLMGRGFIC